MHFFRNIIAFTYPDGMDFTALEPAMELLAFQPCAAQAMSSEGFVPVLDEGTDAPRYTHQYGGCIVFSVQIETRIVPPRVVDDVLHQRLAEIEAKEGRRPGGRERKRLKDDVIAELMAKSFTSKTRTRAMIDLERRLLLVDTSSRKVADGIASHIRSALGSFPCVALTTRMPAMVWMTSVARSGNLPKNLGLGDSCVIKGPDSAKVTIKKLDLRGEEVQGHLEAGMCISQLQLAYADQFTWVLDEALTVRQFTCVAEVEMPDDGEVENELSARMFLLSTHFRQLIDVLNDQVGINFAN